MNPLVPAKNLSTYWLVFLDILANRVPRHFGQQSSTYWPSGPSSDSSTFWKPSRMLKKFLDILAGNRYLWPLFNAQSGYCFITEMSDIIEMVISVELRSF